MILNNHEDIINIVEDGLRIAYCYGDNGRYPESIVAAQKIAKEVQQRLEYMQSQIDELMLEYCPEEMSKEQLDNWAKNQKVVVNPEYIDKLLQPKICYGRHVISDASDDMEKFVDTNHNELWIDGIRFELNK